MMDGNESMDDGWQTTDGIHLIENDEQRGNWEASYWCLILLVMPFCCIFGNLLVIIAVVLDPSLKNSTNLLLVSLAAADLLVGIFVMPLSIYMLVNNLEWHLGSWACNLFCIGDVALSTSSIVNLVAISMDRFIAVVRHTEYKTDLHRRRIYVTIVFTWFFSILLGLPLGIGLNRREANETAIAYSGYRQQRLSALVGADNKTASGKDYQVVSDGRRDSLSTRLDGGLMSTHCEIVNPSYMLYSSIFAFYIPCIIMAIMYSFVFYRLRQRLRAVKLQEMAAGQMVNFGDNIGNIMVSAYGADNGLSNPSKSSAMTLEQTIHEDESISSEEYDELHLILEHLENHGKPAVTRLASSSSITVPLQEPPTKKFSNTSLRRMSRTIGLKFSRDTVKRKSIHKARQKITGLKDRAVHLLMKLKSKQGMAIRKETRATKLVLTVLIVFLVCWLPFFTFNIVKVFKLYDGTWNADLEVSFTVVTWLGFLNSCLNPIIYSSINRKFRAAFHRILFCQPKRKLGRSGGFKTQNKRRKARELSAALHSATSKVLFSQIQESPLPSNTIKSPIPEVPSPEMNNQQQRIASKQTENQNQHCKNDSGGLQKEDNIFSTNEESNKGLNNHHNLERQQQDFLDFDSESHKTRKLLDYNRKELSMTVPKTIQWKNSPSSPSSTAVASQCDKSHQITSSPHLQIPKSISMDSSAKLLHSPANNQCCNASTTISSIAGQEEERKEQERRQCSPRGSRHSGHRHITVQFSLPMWLDETAAVPAPTEAAVAQEDSNNSPRDFQSSSENGINIIPTTATTTPASTRISNDRLTFDVGQGDQML